MLSFDHVSLSILIFLSLKTPSLQSPDLSRLQAVAMITRHGDRAPTAFYPKDPYSKDNWNVDYGALTEFGAHQLAVSGKIKAIRYSFLKKDGKFDVENIYMVSSEHGRCVDSAKNFLASFLNDSSKESIIEILKKPEDEMLAFDGKHCPKYPLVSVLGLDEDDVRAIVDFKSDEGKIFHEAILNFTGINVQHIGDLGGLHDALATELDHGLRLPDWATDFYYQYIRRFAEVVYIRFATSKYLQARTGVLLYDMVKRLDNSVRGLTQQNIIFYSAHDLNIVAIGHTLGFLDKLERISQFGAMLTVEVYKSALKNYPYVKMFYHRNHKDMYPLQLSLSECDEPCSFAKFKELIAPNCISNYTSYCTI